MSQISHTVVLAPNIVLSTDKRKKNFLDLDKYLMSLLTPVAAPNISRRKRKSADPKKLVKSLSSAEHHVKWALSEVRTVIHTCLDDYAYTDKETEKAYRQCFILVTMLEQLQIHLQVKREAIQEQLATVEKEHLEGSGVSQPGVTFLLRKP